MLKLIEERLVLFRFLSNTTDNALRRQSKGMTMQNLATRMNDGGSGWNINSDERCPISI